MYSKQFDFDFHAIIYIFFCTKLNKTKSFTFKYFTETLEWNCLGIIHSSHRKLISKKKYHQLKLIEIFRKITLKMSQTFIEYT